MRLPPPPPRYDPKEQAETRRAIEQAERDILGRLTVIGPRGAAVANATGAGDVVAQLNALLARLRAHGLIAP